MTHVQSGSVHKGIGVTGGGCHSLFEQCVDLLRVRQNMLIALFQLVWLHFYTLEPPDSTVHFNGYCMWYDIERCRIQLWSSKSTCALNHWEYDVRWTIRINFSVILGLGLQRLYSATNCADNILWCFTIILQIKIERVDLLTNLTKILF